MSDWPTKNGWPTKDNIQKYFLYGGAIFPDCPNKNDCTFGQPRHSRAPKGRVGRNGWQTMYNNQKIKCAIGQPRMVGLLWTIFKNISYMVGQSFQIAQIKMIVLLANPATVEPQRGG
jgi:hypothetical protein